MSERESEREREQERARERERERERKREREREEREKRERKSRKRAGTHGDQRRACRSVPSQSYHSGDATSNIEREREGE